MRLYKLDKDYTYELMPWSIDGEYQVSFPQLGTYFRMSPDHDYFFRRNIRPETYEKVASAFFSSLEWFDEAVKNHQREVWVPEDTAKAKIMKEYLAKREYKEQHDTLVNEASFVIKYTIMVDGKDILASTLAEAQAYVVDDENDVTIDVDFA